jgi:glyoxylase-like metal-dependent hydrolase (beta-lactamase superfamily II)
MRHPRLTAFAGLLVVVTLAGPAGGQQPAPQPPAHETRKVTDGVYIFRHGGHQSMFVVTPDGVVATDPISPAAAKVYLAEIRKITPAPVRYVIYSHHHLDHIAGGEPFKRAGAIFVAHQNAKARLGILGNADTIPPDVVVDDTGGVITLGGTRLELHYLGRNHSDSTLSMLLPRERILFAVDWLPIKEVLFRNVPDSYIDEWLISIQKVLNLEWDRMIAGHPRQGGIGTKEDVRNLGQYMTDLSAAVRQAAEEGKCIDKAMQEVKLPKYESWGRYKEFLPGNIERFCFYWRNGWN